jgi:hypothetical protein
MIHVVTRQLFRNEDTFVSLRTGTFRTSIIQFSGVSRTFLCFRKNSSDAKSKQSARLAPVKVRAIAIASPRSNVIGAVELSTSAEGLGVVYLDSAFCGADGVPVALGRNSESLVPWERINDARVLGNAVFLELNVGPQIVHRFLLVRFTFGHDRTPHELRHRRVLLRAVALALAIMALVIATLTGPRIAPQSGPLFGVALGALLALLITVAGVISDQTLLTGGNSSALVRDIFIGELMATLPRLPREPGANAATRPAFRLPSLDGILPRTTIAIIITLSGALLASLVMAKWVFWGDHTQAERSARRMSDERNEPERITESIAAATPRPPSTADSVAIASAVGSSTEAPERTGAPPNPGDLHVLGPCTCSRADSPLWREPLPHLTPLVLASRRFPHKNHEDIEVELAVINNSDRPLGNISALVEFFEADKSDAKRLTSVESRTVFFEGPLGSGKAIKWHVQEQGTTFKIHPPTSNGLIIDDVIGPVGEGAASAASFAELLTANNRPVRLHGAMMLAYLGDKRAKPAVVELGEALRDSEGAYLRRVLEATQDQIACQIALGTGVPKSVKACIYNQGAAPVERMTVAVRFLDNVLSMKDPLGTAPQNIGERSLQLNTKIEPKAGVLVEGNIEAADLPAKPVSYEIAVTAQGQ